MQETVHIGIGRGPAGDQSRPFREVQGDAFFPPLPAEGWREVSRAAQPAENGYTYDFVDYARDRVPPQAA